MSDALARVKRATLTRERAARSCERSEEAWREAIRQAHADGSSLRVIGRAAGVSNVWVLKIVRAG